MTISYKVWKESAINVIPPHYIIPLIGNVTHSVYTYNHSNNQTNQKKPFMASGDRKLMTTLMFLSPTNALLYYTYKMLKYTVKISHDCSDMFRSI